jgi:hypothetical protein
MSIHEEITVYAEGPMMGVFNNLVTFDQHVAQNSLGSVVPDLATAHTGGLRGNRRNGTHARILDSIQHDSVTSSYRARRGDHSVHASAGELPQLTELDPIVANERPKNIGILWKIVLGKGRHHASGIEQRHAELCPITERECMTNPVVLDETRSVCLQNYVHPKPAHIEAGRWLQLAQPRERG